MSRLAGVTALMVGAMVMAGCGASDDGRWSSPAAPSASVASPRPSAEPAGNLLGAAQTGDIAAVQRALASGTSVEVRDDRQRTPLLLAVTHDHVDVARVLVAAGADVNALDGQHDTPFLVTGVTGSVPMLEVLLPARPDMTIVNRFGGVAVIPASERGHVEYVRRIVTTEMNLNHVNDLGWTALLECVYYGDGGQSYQEIARILLDADADPTIPDANGMTALDHAQRRGFTELAAILRR